MDIILWIAMAFIVDADGPHAVAADKPYRSEAACMEHAREAALEFVKMPEVLMLATNCVQVKARVTPSGEAVLKGGKTPAREFSPQERSGGVINGKSFL